MSSETVVNASASSLKELSDLYADPDWLRELRLKAFKEYEQLPLEKSPLYSKYVDVDAIPFDKIAVADFDAGQPRLPSELDSSLKDLEKGCFLIQYNGHVVKKLMPDVLREKGVIFTDIKTAIRDHSALVRSYLEARAKSSEDDKLSALNTAFFTSGTFLFVPAKMEITLPFRTITILDNPRAGVFNNNLIVGDSRSKFMILQECYSGFDGNASADSLWGEMTEIHANDEAQVDFANVQNFDESVITYCNRKSYCGRNATLSWTAGLFGGKITRTRIDHVMQGEGAFAHDLSVLLGARSQHFSVRANLVHKAPNTKGVSLSKGVLKDSATSLLMGMIRIDKGAKNSQSYLAEHSMLLSEEAKSNSIPGLEVETNDVKATHSASVAQIDKDQIFYLMSRGLDEDNAKKMIVGGFFEPALQRIPVVEVRAMISDLIELKWSGEKIESRPKIIPELAAPEVERKTSQDIFEGHYKYR